MPLTKRLAPHHLMWAMFVVALVVLGYAVRQRVAVAEPTPTSFPADYGSSKKETTETVLVLIGSGNCGWSKADNLPHALDLIQRNLAAKARESGQAFSSIGVAIDLKQGDGIRWLDKVGTFDQIAVGASWLNQGVVTYVWRDHAGQPMLPQLVLLERKVTYGNTGVIVGPESLKARVLGLREIIEYQQRLAPT